MMNTSSRSIFLLTAIAICCFGSAVQVMGQNASPTSVRNTPPDVVSVTFDKEVVYTWCNLRFHASGNEECPENGTKVKVSATAQDRENSPIIYIYRVTGGRIVGQGSNVIWDLTKMPRGDYSITVSADDGSGTKGKSVSKTVKLEECPECDRGCDCPLIRVLTHVESARRGEIVDFEAQTIGGDIDLKDLKYNWTLTDGEIISGQGTKKIKVKTTNLKSASLTTATAEFGGMNPRCNCPNTASESISLSDLSTISDGIVKVVELNLDRMDLNLPCEPGRKSPLSTCSEDMVISVSTKVDGKTNQKLEFLYTVTGGSIIGEGPAVRWDLTGVRPGTYTIAAKADDGCGFCGKGVEKTVTVSNCPDCGCCLIDCPSVSISEPGAPDILGRMVFTADVSGGSQDTVTYSWTVTNGEIVDGQGTPWIKVKMPTNISGPDPTITVEIGISDEIAKGSCPLTVTKTIPKSQLPR